MPDMTYRLHYAPDNASLIVRLVLEELGLPYTVALVDRAAKAQEQPAYRAVNPTGLIPALETGDGVLFETAAILLWLADTHGRMAPAPDSPARGPFLRTLFFVSNTLHAQMRMVFYPWKYVGDDPAAQDALRTKLLTPHATDMSVPGGLALLDAYLGTCARSADDMPSILECYAAALVRWCTIYPADRAGWLTLDTYPHLQTLVRRLDARPATRTVAKAEGLGPHPFSQATLPNPPEGSAL
ncbi:glutathione S-transferase family protein [uncultured Tateyamaria sp.]|uniref:glutathione S-transferase family protein n=1 Tax=uncultured Tateyamaria sp. TaxID=455651 RepID=UPI00344D1564